MLVPECTLSYMFFFATFGKGKSAHSVRWTHTHTHTHWKRMSGPCSTVGWWVGRTRTRTPGFQIRQQRDDDDDDNVVQNVSMHVVRAHVHRCRLCVLVVRWVDNFCRCFLWHTFPLCHSPPPSTHLTACWYSRRPSNKTGQETLHASLRFFFSLPSAQCKKHGQRRKYSTHEYLSAILPQTIERCFTILLCISFVFRSLPFRQPPSACKILNCRVNHLSSMYIHVMYSTCEHV